MANAIEERGQFWWFGETGQTSSLEQAVHGLLTISEEGLITLQLEGPLYLENSDVSWEWDASRWLPDDKRILGRLGKSGDAGWVLLQGLYRTDFSFNDEPARQSYEANFCFKHEHGFPSNFDADQFHTLRIELKGLEDWLKLQAIDVGEEVWHGNETEFTVKHDRIEISYETDRATVSIENIVLGNSPIRLFHGKVSEVRIWQTNWLVYQPKDQLDLARFQVSFRQAEELIALLTGRYFSLEWPNLVAKFGEWDEWFTLYWQRGRRNETAPSIFFMLTEFPAVRDDFGKMFDRLQAGAETYGPGYSLYAASMQQPLPYPEHEFINLVWSIESLHRGWERERPDVPTIERRKKRIEMVLSRFAEPADKKLHDWLAGRIKYAFEPTLEARIFDSFQRLPFDLDAGQLRVFAQRCARRRNDISHEGGQRPGENAEDFRRELRTLADALRYLFHGLLLHEIGLNRAVVESVHERGNRNKKHCASVTSSWDRVAPHAGGRSIDESEHVYGGVFMSQRLGDKREMPDVPKFDFVDVLAEIWFQINFAAYHMAYVRVYSQSEALRTQAQVLRTQDQDVRDHVQIDIVICRSHLAAFFWHLEHVFEALRIAITRGKKELPGEKYFWAYEKRLDELEQLAIRQEIKDYRNMSHQSPAIIGNKWDEKGRFVHHFLPTISGHKPQEDLEMNTRLQQYFEFAANVWLEFAPGDLKEKFPRDFRFPVTIPFLFGGELSEELKRHPQLEVQVNSYDKKMASPDQMTEQTTSGEPSGTEDNSSKT